MKQTVVAIIGVGAVGSTIAYALLLKNCVSQIILVDIDRARCAGEVKDLADALGFSYSSLIYQGTYEDAKKADIIIISAGRPQKPGQSRIELIDINVNIMKTILKDLEGGNPEALLIVVSNPLDILTYVAQEMSHLPRQQIFGTGTFLDSQRLKHYLSCTIGIAEESIEGFVLGEHGDSQVVAWSTVTIAGNPIEYFGIDKRRQEKIAQVVRQEAYEIIQAKGATFYGIAACVATLCQMIIFNRRQIVPISWYHEKYQVCLSLPTLLGSKGVIQVIEPLLSEYEKEQLSRSALTLKEVVDGLSRNQK